ncbi:efflux RND transporter periplasmic adaptor subunit [Dongia rigui]|uniref:Efflux RND transporter periplasmic adaptor subunit n=1 Tax=Dongia rigui TaxID=940149 RepID=A0ABU5E333_9PROT|nr:efflux RND transporter periplasmic adaptor subunit [Dongia rigui]MDY0873604.1 efflux RND transporter periplasmic adaptor subunit [Dongia rigui]
MLKPAFITACLLVATQPLLAVAARADDAPAAPQALTVGTIAAAKQAVAKSQSFVGRVEAVERVEVVARVSGYLDQIHFTEGGMVKAGDPLYTLEKSLYEAAVQQAQASVESAKAGVLLAKQQKGRTQELLSKDVASKMTMDQRVAEQQQAQADQAMSEAAVRTAQINLSYTEITSPIAGKIGRTAVTRGNVVGPNSGVLTTIVSQDPMYVTFPVSQRDFLRAGMGSTGTGTNGLLVKISFSDGTVYADTGKINFVDVTTDKTTDTITVRATFPNPAGTLVDGQFVNVVLESAKPEEVVVVPQSALLADQQGTYVFVVEDNKAVVKRIKPGGEHGPNIVVSEGLTGGEWVIVEGLQFVRPDMPVQAAPISAANPS